jgi:multiple sugar transport system substrate-binding protein
MKARTILSALLAAATVIPLAACSQASSNASGGSAYTVNWWTWDPNQAAAYEQCIPAFEKANPGIKVKVTQYDVSAYFTKLPADFVAGNAPDAFQDSLMQFQSQLEPLDSYLKSGQLQAYSVGTAAWQGQDGKQYGLPMDWASAVLYYDKATLAPAGISESEVQNATWDPTTGGTFQKIIEHLTIDKNGKRGDQPGFNKSQIKTYGVSPLSAADWVGQTSWYPFAAATGWRLGNKTAWPTQFQYTDPRFIQTQDWIKKMTADGYMPNYNYSTLSGTQQLGAGKIAMAVDGSWGVSSYAALPNMKVGIARTPQGPDGRKVLSNSNGNVMWKGSPNKQATFKWMSYQESQACQTTASTYNGSFFPAIAASMLALEKSEQAKNVDLSAFVAQQTGGDLVPMQPFTNATAVGNSVTPLFEAYYTGQQGDSVWAEAAQKSAQAIAGQQP